MLTVVILIVHSFTPSRLPTPPDIRLYISFSPSSHSGYLLYISLSPWCLSTAFVATARALELVGISAYAGGAGLISSKSILQAAAQILSIEARHQTLLNTLNAGSPIPNAFDMALLPQQVLALAGGFLSGCKAEDLGLTSGCSLWQAGERLIHPNPD